MSRYHRTSGHNLLERVNGFLAIDQLELRPVLDGLDDQRAPEDRGRHIVHYELCETGAAGRRKMGVVSKSFLAALGRMAPRAMSLCLDLGNHRPSLARQAAMGRRGRA